MKRFLQSSAPLSQRAGLAINAMAYSLCAALSVSIVMPFVNIIFTDIPVSLPGISIPTLPSKYSALLLLCATTWIIFLFKNFFFFLSSRIQIRLKIALARQLRTEYLRQIFLRDLNYFHSIGVSDLSVQLIQTIDRIAEKVIGSTLMFSRNSGLLILYATILILISWKLMLASLVAVPIVSWITHRLRNSNLRHIESDQSSMLRLAQDVQQKSFAIKLIKLFHSESYETEKFLQKNLLWSEAQSKRSWNESLNYVLVEMCGVTLGVLLLYLIGMENINGYFNYGPGGLVLFIAAVFSMIDPSKELYEAIRRRSEAEMLWNNLNDSPLPRQNTHFQAMTQKFASLEFNNVSFHYPQSPSSVVQNVTVQIYRGEIIAITGKSGSGKSTFIDLMTGLQQPTQGTVAINSIDVSQINPHDRAKIFGVITQEPLLFNDSLYNNISYNLHGITEQQVVEVLRLVQADHLIAHRNGVHTILGDRGNQLSGGEKQRVILARMVLRDPEIVILDEATSALGETMERDILNTIFKIFAGRTIVMISHRPSVWTLAERVLEIRRHRIIERSAKHSLLHEKFAD